MGFRSGLDIVEKKNVSCPYRNSNPGPSSLMALKLIVVMRGESLYSAAVFGVLIVHS
jgi:hypothetical protein